MESWTRVAEVRTLPRFPSIPIATGLSATLVSTSLTFQWFNSTQTPPASILSLSLFLFHPRQISHCSSLASYTTAPYTYSSSILLTFSRCLFLLSRAYLWPTLLCCTCHALVVLPMHYPPLLYLKLILCCDIVILRIVYCDAHCPREVKRLWQIETVRSKSLLLYVGKLPFGVHVTRASCIVGWDVGVHEHVYQRRSSMSTREQKFSHWKKETWKGSEILYFVVCQEQDHCWEPSQSRKFWGAKRALNTWLGLESWIIDNILLTTNAASLNIWILFIFYWWLIT